MKTSKKKRRKYDPNDIRTWRWYHKLWDAIKYLFSGKGIG